MSKLLTIKWMHLLVHIWRNRETNGKQQLDNLTRIGSLVTHFQLPPYEFRWATRQAKDIALGANSLGTWFFSKEKLRGRMQRLLEIILYRTEYRGGVCLPVVFPNGCRYVLSKRYESLLWYFAKFRGWKMGISVSSLLVRHSFWLLQIYKRQIFP